MDSIIQKKKTKYWKYFPKVAGIYITRRCNSRCSYCSVPKRQYNDELSVDEWKNAIDIIEKIGIEKVTILGGELTLFKDINKIISHITTNTSLSCSVVTNCNGSDLRLEEMINAGLKRVSMSIDTLSDDYVDLHSLRKSKAAISKISQFKERGIEHITAYLMLNRQNLKSISSIAKFLSDNEVWIYIIPYHY